MVYKLDDVPYRLSGQGQETPHSRLWEHILNSCFQTTDVGHVRATEKLADPEGYAFFEAIDAAFSRSDKMNGRIPVDQRLVQYIASWARASVKKEDLSGGRNEHCVRRAMDGFIQTLHAAVQHNQLRYFEDGRVLYGCFEVPKWFIEETLEMVQVQALYENSLWDEDDGWKEYFRHFPLHPPT
jgi:hypothetical protein